MTRMLSDANPSNRTPTAASPAAPLLQAFVLCFSSESAMASPPSLPHFARYFASSSAVRHS
jgi:hypothetical protein